MSQNYIQIANSMSKLQNVDRNRKILFELTYNEEKHSHFRSSIMNIMATITVITTQIVFQKSCHAVNMDHQIAGFAGSYDCIEYTYVLICQANKNKTGWKTFALK